MSNTVSAGATIEAPGTTTGIRLAVAAVSIIAFVTTAAIVHPNGQQTSATRPITYFRATPAIAGRMKKERNSGLSAQPAVSRTPPTSLTIYCTDHDNQPNIQSNAYATAVPIDPVFQITSHTLACGSAGVFPEMNVTNLLSTSRGSIPREPPNDNTTSLSRISHSRRKSVAMPMKKTFTNNPR